MRDKRHHVKGYRNIKPFLHNVFFNIPRNYQENQKIKGKK